MSQRNEGNWNSAVLVWQLTQKPGGSRHGVPLRSVMDRLRLWRERMGTRRRLRDLYALDDHILQDIGMTRTALRWEAEKPFRR
jgi:uncharacterized protein YjiS (DUF1127 family)